MHPRGWLREIGGSLLNEPQIGGETRRFERRGSRVRWNAGVHWGGGRLEYKTQGDRARYDATSVYRVRMKEEDGEGSWNSTIRPGNRGRGIELSLEEKSNKEG